MNITEVRKSELFETLAWMGLLSTEEYRIREVRNAPFDRFIDLDLANDDIERVGYLYPHVSMKKEFKGITELWFEDTYLNPKELTWIETNHSLCAVTTAADLSLYTVCALLKFSSAVSYLD